MAKNNKILIVDDEPEMVEELKEILESEGYIVDSAFNGEEALLKFNKGGINLVLLDIKMPRMNGVEVYRKMRKINSSIPIIIVTGSFAKKNAEQILQEGADAIIYKPFEVEELLTLIRKEIQ